MVNALMLRSNKRIGWRQRNRSCSICREAGRDARSRSGPVEIAKIASEVHSDACPAPERGRMAEFGIRILLRGLDHEGIEIAERRRNRSFAPSIWIIDSIVFITASVSGTFFLLDQRHGRRST